MSRYTIAGKESFYEVVVGWDNPLETFFTIVYDTRQDDPCAEHRIVLWEGGAQTGEIASIHALAEILRPYADIPQDTASALLKDSALGHVTQGTLIREQMKYFEDPSDMTDPS